MTCLNPVALSNLPGYNMTYFSTVASLCTDAEFYGQRPHQ